MERQHLVDEVIHVLAEDVDCYDVEGIVDALVNRDDGDIKSIDILDDSFWDIVQKH